MNWNFSSNSFALSCLVSPILTPLALSKWLTQIFVVFNIFNKGGINEVHIECTLKRMQE